MARTKEVEIEGRKYKLASLSMNQVEESWDDPKPDLKAIRARSWQNILYSLHNAGSNITLDELKSQLTLDGYKQLHEYMLEVSYLQVDEQGEPKAVAETQTSSSSVAA